jgi:PST family polysaccharide transporter
VTRAELRSLFLRGGATVAAGAIVARLLQAATWFVLARMLVPSDFGALALAAVFVNALALLPGLGLSTALLARVEDPRPLAPTALAASLRSGALLIAAAAGVAVLVGRDRGRDVGAVVAVLGVSLFFQGAGAVAAALLDRELRFRARALADAGGGVAFLAVAVVAAQLGAGAVALALGLVASSAVTAVAACAAARLAPARRPDFAALRATARIGLVVLATTVLQWLFVSSDVWIVERRFDREAVGCYGAAMQLALLPATTLGLFAGRLVLPALMRQRALGRESRATFLAVARVSALAGGGAALLLALLAGPLVRLLYGERFAAAASILPPLALYSFARVLGGLGGPALLASGRASVALLLVAAQDAIALPLALALPAVRGPRGVALVYAAVAAAAGVAALVAGERGLRARDRSLAGAPARAVAMAPGGAP